MASSRPHLSIDDWLKKLELSVYRCLLKDYNAVEDILWMSERDLKNIGIKSGSHRARLSSSLTILKEKYDKLSREDQDFNADKSKWRAENGNKSFSSLSPVSRMSIEKPQSGVRSWPSSVSSSSYHTKHSSPRSSMEGYGTESTVNELKQALERELSLDGSDLRSFAWYHGTILRQRAEELVAYDGDFIVRDCISQPGDYVITCKWKNTPLHFIIKKVILNPDTLYERIQYFFEKDSFDSIPDFITYYVGSKCSLSESSGAIICHPINRTMPLTYYASRYGIQCQIHYVARKLENLPPENNVTVVHPSDNDFKADVPNQLIAEKSEHKKNSLSGEKSKHNPVLKLTRVGSDPMLSPNMERKRFQHRPNSGNFSTEVQLVSLKIEDKPPPKPSRVPSMKCAQKPFVCKRNRSISIDEGAETAPENTIKIRGISPTHQPYKRQSSETRFSFLDRPSVSSDDGLEIPIFTIPSTNPPSVLDPQGFSTELLSQQNSPLEGAVLSQVKEGLFETCAKTLAYHLTWVDLEMTKNSQDADLGVGVTSGLELFLLPQGLQLQKDLLERTECMKLFVATTILTTPSKEERVQLLNKWIEIAIETKTAVGNLFGFTSIMLGLTLPEVLGLRSTWLALRYAYTESAFAFETKLRPTLKSLQQASGLEAPNTCLPYILSLNLILQKYREVMDIVDNNPFETEYISENILDFDIPGGNNSTDFGLQLLENHLEVGRYIMQQSPVFKQNGRITLHGVKYESMLLDIFSSEFHLRMLWGFRGSVVCPEERYQKFQKVLILLHNKCNEEHT